MGFVGDIVKGVTSNNAAKSATRAQTHAANKAIEFTEESRDIARSDLQPFREAGTRSLRSNKAAPSLATLVSNPAEQRKYIEENPLYQGLRDDAFRDVTTNAAARGKLGSGGTLEELQRRYLSLGRSLISQDIAERTNLATLGANAASGQATATQQTSNPVSDLLTQRGNAAAAGKVAQADAINGVIGSGQNRVNQAVTFLSDMRAKEDIERVGILDNGIGVYRYRYKGEGAQQIGVIAQEVEKVVPSAVTERDGLKYVNYGAL